MQILNCKIDPLDMEQVLGEIRRFLESEKQHRIATVNAEYIFEAQKDARFREIINSADLSIADGIGPIWAAKFLSLPVSKNKILRYPQIVLQYMCTGASLMFFPSYCKSIIRERVSGIDLVEEIKNHSPAGESKIKNLRIFLLGGYNPEKIQEKYPDVIIGTYEGNPDIQNDEKIREIINQAKPNILFVAYGNPASKQEKWISRNLKYLPTVKVAMGVGGSFDFLSGEMKRAPEWMRKIGIEWMFRLAIQPKRIRRIWNAVGVFSKKILMFKIKNQKANIKK